MKLFQFVVGMGFLAISCFADEAIWQKAAQPDWVEKVPVDESKSSKSTRSVDWLLLDNQIRFDSVPSEFFRLVARVNSAQGLADVAEFQVDVVPEYQRLSLHYAHIVRQGKKIDALASAAIHVLQRETNLENGMFTGEKTVHVVLSDVRPGDRVEYAYSVQGENPVFQGIPNGFLMLGWGTPIQHQHIRMLAPSKSPLALRTYALAMQPDTAYRGDWVAYTWNLHNLPVLPDDDDVPGDTLGFPMLQYSGMTEWSQVEDWAKMLYSGDHALPAALLDSARLWKKKSENDEERIAAALHAVQNNIRYYGVEMGINSHLPRTPAQVWELRYGDCKDKAWLLSELLRAMGISAWPALVNTSMGKSLQELLPSPGLFDHVIVKSLVHGKTVWLDPTLEGQAGPLRWLSRIPYGLGLAVGDSITGPETIALADVELPTDEQSLRFEFQSPDAPVLLTIRSRYRYDGAEDMRLKAMDAEAMALATRNTLGKQYGSVRVASPLRMRDIADSNLVIVDESYWLDEFLTADMGGWSGAVSLDILMLSLPRPEVVQRQLPFALPYPYWNRVEAEVVFPPGTNMESFASVTSLRQTSDYTLSFHQNTEKNIWKLAGEFRTRRDRIAPAAIRKWIVDSREISKNWVVDFDFPIANAPRK